MDEDVRRFYRLPADAEYPFDRLGHFVVGMQPEGAEEISDAAAKVLHDETTARTPTTRVPLPAGEAVNLQPLQDQIDAIASAVVGHAKALDAHAGKLAETAEISQSTKASVVEFMENVKAGRQE